MGTNANLAARAAKLLDTDDPGAGSWLCGVIDALLTIDDKLSTTLEPPPSAPEGLDDAEYRIAYDSTIQSATIVPEFTLGAPLFCLFSDLMKRGNTAMWLRFGATEDVPDRFAVVCVDPATITAIQRVLRTHDNRPKKLGERPS